MSYVERHVVQLTTDGSGNATGYTPVVTGEVRQIVYAKGDFADGVDFAITVEATGETVWTETDVNASKACAPRLQVASTAGVAAESASEYAVRDRIVVAHDRIKIAVASGGTAKSGTFHVLIG